MFVDLEVNLMHVINTPYPFKARERGEGREGENTWKGNSERRYMLRSKGKRWNGPRFNVHTKKSRGYKQLDGPVDGWMAWIVEKYKLGMMHLHTYTVHLTESIFFVGNTHFLNFLLAMKIF
jgi:hypothetical protein